MQVQILLRFAWQCVAVLLIARYRPDIPQPFRMWLYPIPALLSLALWIALFFTGPPTGVWFSLGFLGLGLSPTGSSGAGRPRRPRPTEPRSRPEPRNGALPPDELVVPVELLSDRSVSHPDRPAAFPLAFHVVPTGRPRSGKRWTNGPCLFPSTIGPSSMLPLA